jgi:tRNA(fMet)-specific endonuclease VapC
MRYLLDTNAVIALLKESSEALARRVRGCAPSDVAMSSIVLHELYFGAYKSQRVERNLSAVDGLLFQVLDFSPEDAREAGRIRAEVTRQGQPVGPFDLLIAGQAAARGLTLITRNGRELSCVPDLLWEDWELA